jgi:hypothetical protein
MTALPRELKARCEAVTTKLSDPRIAGAAKRIVQAEAQQIIEEIEELRNAAAFRAAARSVHGANAAGDETPPPPRAFGPSIAQNPM